MTKLFHSALLFVFICLFFGCTEKQNKSLPISSELKVKWEVVTNMYQGKTQALAAFTIYNQSKMTLENRGWAMFFSQLPPTPIIEDSVRVAKVVHINGDWFKLIPSKNFRLLPGDSIRINYCGTGFMIKKTDAAMGMYFVFYDANDKESGIVPVGKQIIGDFTRPEQLMRKPEDESMVPTPESRYAANLKLNLLNENLENNVIPTPHSFKSGKEPVFIDKKWQIFYGEGLDSEAGYLIKRLKGLTGEDFTIVKGTPDHQPAFSMQLESGRTVKSESYQLTIDPKNGIKMVGKDAAGVFYAIQSFLASLPASAFQNKKSTLQTASLLITDEPRFPYRGLQFDMSRSFQTKETMLKMLDIMAFYKLNHFLFYFMEDEGWRVEIPGLPELTQIGSRRLHGNLSDPSLHPSYGSGPFADAKDSYGSGYYTSDEFVEMLKFAKERHITVIPVINFPAHVRSAIKSMEFRYQRLMKEGKVAEANEYRLIDPEDTSKYISAQGYHDNVVCVGRESVYHFYDTAVKGIRKMYEQAGVPMEIFHTGGDEVAAGAWNGSPMVKKLLSEHPEIKPDDKSLQAYCLRRISAILKDNGVKDIGGWEEAALISDANGKPTPNFEFVGKGLLPYLWNNTEGAEDLGYKLANAGYKVVLCDVSNFYLDFPYDKDPVEPGNYWAGFLDTKQFYAFAPFDLFKTTTKTAMGRTIDTDKEYSGKVRLKPEARKNILGVQAQIWSETIKGEAMLEYYYLPRLIAFSETAWSTKRKWETIENRDAREKQLTSDWNKIANILALKELPRLSQLNGGYNFRVPLPGAIIKDGMLNANVEFPGLEIRFTTDATEPTLQSQLYTQPVKVSGTVKLMSFVIGGKSSRISEVQY
ncbi:MAG: carbohydate-binding domain-containing protein [Prolixibacteraceae bacterium]|jgi:hexosaminidase|nr:carbohydate-binding domain-containing protein [Prolixibacteraceae bacterium]